MPKINIKGHDFDVDEEGFLQEPDRWTRDIAEEIARGEATACPMTPDHWKVVDYIRNYYMEYDIAPPIRMLVKATGLDLNKINQLFPKGPAKGACKVAGLSKPTGCV